MAKEPDPTVSAASGASRSARLKELADQLHEANRRLHDVTQGLNDLRELQFDQRRALARQIREAYRDAEAVTRKIHDELERP